MRSLIWTVLFTALFVFNGPVSFAFTPHEVLVVYNSQPLPDPSSLIYATAIQIVPASEGVAKYYAQARGIPACNLLGLPQASFYESISENLYVPYIATPISNYLSTHPNIKVIVLCYGIPTTVFGTPYGSVDAALMLMGNPNILSQTHWGLRDSQGYLVHNPFYNSSVSWDEFRDSSANTIDAGNGQTWKLNYLVTRLDGFSSPTTTVTISGQNYSIPSDVKEIIDRAERANSAGVAGLDDAIAVIDDGGSSNWIHSPSTVSTLNDLLEPITGSGDNVHYLPSANYEFAVDEDNVLGYSSPGSYDYSADLSTTWWRPHNTWKDGSVALYWNVSTDASYLRAANFDSSWDSGCNTDPANIEPGVFRVNVAAHISSLYDGTILRLFGSDPKVLLAETQFQDGIARIDLNTIQWPSNYSTFFERCFADNDVYHPGETFARTDLGVNLYEAWSESAGYTYNAGAGQSRSVELIRDGASATAGNASEPHANCTPNPNVILPKYTSGYTWAESAIIGMPYVSWQQLSIGDPLMAACATPPTVEITTPSTDGTTISGTTYNVAATATPVNATGIKRVEFWLTDGEDVCSLLATDYTSPYGFIFDTTTLSDGRYLLGAVAYEDTSVRECGMFCRPVIVNNGGSPTSVSITSPSTDGSVLSNTATIAVSATPSTTPETARVDLWLHSAARDIMIGTVYAGTAFNFDFDTTQVPAGSYGLQAVAYSSTGQASASSVRQAYIDNSSLVQITEPATDGQQKSGKFTMTASTDPNASVAHVDFWLGQNSCRGILVASDTTVPYTCDIDSTTFKNGDYTIRAFAYDASNVFLGASTLRTVSIDNSTLITIVNPSMNGQTISEILPVDVTVATSDPVINSVDLWIYGQNATRTISDIASPFSWTIDTTTIANGSYTLKAIGYKLGGGQVADSPTRTITVSNPNLLSITSPATDGTILSGTTTLVIGAQSSNPDYGRIEINFTGKSSATFNITSRPFEYALNTTSLTDGVYTITVYAYKPDGRKVASSSATRTVIINNNHTACARIHDARALSNGSLCKLEGQAVSAGTGDSMDGAFYIEESDRTAGVRVAWTGSTIPVGKKVTVLGTIGNNTSTGEREITADDVWISTENSSIAPLGMNNFLIGGAAPVNELYTPGITDGVGLYNIGLLVRIWGKVKYVGDNYIYIDDGSAGNIQDGNTLEGPIIVPLDGSAIPTTYPQVKGIRVYCENLTKPGIGDYVSITGISSTKLIGSNIVRHIRVRNQNDICYVDAYKRCAKKLNPDSLYDGYFVDINQSAIPVGSKIRLINAIVDQQYGSYMLVRHIDTAISWSYTHLLLPTYVSAATALTAINTVTITGTSYANGNDQWIQTDAIYLGGSTYGAMGAMSVNQSSLDAASALSVDDVMLVEENEGPEIGGGPFRAWPYPTAEEILASNSFQQRYSQIGAIGWVISQPDGTLINLAAEATCGKWYDGQVFGLREWFEPIPNGANLLLYLDAPIKLEGDFKNIATIDVIGGTLVTLSDGRKALMKPEAVYVYTDSKGKWTPPVPWLKTMSTNGVTDSSEDWPWKTKVAP